MKNQTALYKLCLFAGCLLMLCSTGCVSRKAFQQALYFKDSVTEAEKMVANNPVIIRPGDRLNINITAINKEAAEQFNMNGGTGATAGAYLVDSLGNIQLLQLGTIRASGYSAAQLQDTLQQMLNPYLKGSIVTVSIANFRINMMGEIGRAGVLEVPDGNINILQAITQAGDLKEDARRDNILVIREVNGKREFGRVDISTNHVFNSPYFYLQQNDIVYIEPDRKKYQGNDAEMTRVMRNYGFAVAVLSTILLVTNLIKLL
ncbi:MAG TPA: polysaccharide biosynthesis/export family protein [Chitinophagaceae bacterium]|nr:polysaccharide biosynthesis/export family protein [Chitinophagaceae bacterium]